jgi:hypothetical protein
LIRPCALERAAAHSNGQQLGHCDENFQLLKPPFQATLQSKQITVQLRFCLVAEVHHRKDPNAISKNSRAGSPDASQWELPLDRFHSTEPIQEFSL